MVKWHTTTKIYTTGNITSENKFLYFSWRQKMKKYIFVLILSITAFLGFAQVFDDLPYSNPSSMTYFQQEMTSLMRFQAGNDINIPVFVSYSSKNSRKQYISDYLKSLYSDYPEFFERMYSDGTYGEGVFDFNLMGGVQIKINKAVYIPLFFNMGSSGYDRLIEEYEYVYEGIEYKMPLSYEGPSNIDFFFGGGVFINTDIVKGGIYMGWNYVPVSSGDRIFLPIGDMEISSGGEISGFKIALVPLVNTSGWKYVGKVLDNILGYLGIGNTVILADDEGDSKIATFANSLNSALDFTFNRIDFGYFGLTAQTIYTRGNYDAAAKTDTFGLKLNGLFSNFPFGFTLEGGYKHFYYVAKYFEEDYPDTGYFNASIYFPFKHITFGLIYNYDSVKNSMITIALSTNFLSGFFGLSSVKDYDKDKYKSDRGTEYGARFRWGGWKVGKE
jgi:hypothetical protein